MAILETDPCLYVRVLLVQNEARDGSFPTRDVAQPAVTSLVVLAFLATGNLPGESPYGDRIDAALDFVMSCQKPNGLLALQQPNAGVRSGNATHTAIYNHAIAGLLLCEVYGMTERGDPDRMRDVIERALTFTCRRLPAHRP